MGCASVLPPDTSISARAAERAAIEAVWNANYVIVLEAMKRPTTLDQDRFVAAIAFFERTTGITSDTGTFLGRLPTDDLPATLRQWQKWFDENRTLMRLDLESCGVRIDSRAE